MKTKSLHWRITLLLALSLSIQTGFIALIVYLEGDIKLWLLASLLLSLILIPLYISRVLRPLTALTDAMTVGFNALHDKDYSITLGSEHYDEFDSITKNYNNLVKVLRDERMTIFQRELMLDTVIQITPVAMLLVNSSGIIVYSNTAAKTLLNCQTKLDGNIFLDAIKHIPTALYQATMNQHNGLISEQMHDEAIVYQLNCQQFLLRNQTHSLYTYKNMTAEISRKESDIWKKVIRLISHELNNSLAPIASLTHSAKKIINSKENSELLPDILNTIERRSEHLHQFIKQYANFARLPSPLIIKTELADFIDNLRRICAVDIQVKTSVAYGYFDASQIEQVLINLVKNAHESDSQPNEISVTITDEADSLKFTVLDKGKGLSEQQMAQALLPFFSTKPAGTGVGLALCNEIIGAHQGKLQLKNRADGGLSVSFTLPNNFSK